MSRTGSNRHLEKPVSRAFRGALRGLSIGEMIINDGLAISPIQSFFGIIKANKETITY